jgi:putative ABC transport system ATP-binding protein
MLIELESVSKIYNQGRANEVTAVDNVSLRINAGEMVCLRGASGSGKSTLLSIIGCIFPPTSGRAAINGKQLSRMPDRFLTLHRRVTIGFIFQQFNILPYLSVSENVELPLMPLGIAPKERTRRSEKLLQKLSILHRKSFPADQISGGELQRVAMARALIHDPPIILADEPTAHLDSKLSLEFLQIMDELRQTGKTIIITSHDQVVTEHEKLDRIIDLKDGRVHVP